MGWISNIIKRVQDTTRLIQDLPTLKRKVEEHLTTFGDVFGGDWCGKAIGERDATVERIRSHVLNDLIPAAGALSLAGAPGILVYTPCQIAGALAIAHVYRRNSVRRMPDWLTVTAIMIWGKIGQVTWIVLSDVLKPILSPPVVGIAVIPYVREWTRLALQQVAQHYRQDLTEEERHGSTAPSPTARYTETATVADLMREDGCVGRPVLTPAMAADTPVVRETTRMREHLRDGGKILYDEQAQVFREVISHGGEGSARTLGRTHVFRGVAGSGKTVILAQLVPHLAKTFHEQHGAWPRMLVYHHNNYLRKLLETEIWKAIDAPIDLESLPPVVAGQVSVRDVFSLTKDLARLGALNPGAFSDAVGRATTSAEKARQLHPHVRNAPFDIILADEGQDIEEVEFRLLTDLCKPDGRTGRPSCYIFYDDLQNMYGQQDAVIERLRGHRGIRHFLKRCIRTPRSIVEFAVNACLGASVDADDRGRLERALGLEELLNDGLVVRSARIGVPWLRCDFCVFPGHLNPIVQSFRGNADCYAAVCRDLVELQSMPEYGAAFQSGVLIICPGKRTTVELYDALAPSLGGLLHLRSGERDKVSREVKLTTAAVESGINIALVEDAKGYDADVVGQLT